MADKCVFLDRDNTIIHDPGYLRDPKAVRLLAGVGEALRRLSSAGYKLVVVTNQSGIARGLLTDAVLTEIHAEVQRQLDQHGVRLDAIYFCPYHPEGSVEEFAMESPDRKPSPGMLLRAAKELKLDLAASWMVGDTMRDVEAGQRAGCRTVLVTVGWAERRALSGQASPTDAEPASGVERNGGARLPTEPRPTLPDLAVGPVSQPPSSVMPPDFIANDLSEAADIILRHERG